MHNTPYTLRICNEWGMSERRKDDTSSKIEENGG